MRAIPITEEFPADNPLSIEYLREGTYPGSQIDVKQELNPGSNYRRYYVSYFSEGLEIHALMTIPDGETPETGWPVIILIMVTFPQALTIPQSVTKNMLMRLHAGATSFFA